MIKRLLIANRGEIACRIIKTCQQMGIETVAVCSLCDKSQRHVKLADRSVCIGDNDAASSYLNINNIIQAALSTECDAIHPGYGFLSENHEFALKVKASGLIFVGPNPEAIRLANNKVQLKNKAKMIGIPVVDGSDDIITSKKQADDWASRVGFPLIIKANHGEGGRSIMIAQNHDQLYQAYQTLKDRSVDIYIETFHQQVKHIEVQLVADHHGNMVFLGLRDCSMQLDFAKVVEETCDWLDHSHQKNIIQDAIAIAKTIGIDNACTVEFLIDPCHDHFLLEINPRIQVEHPVSEMTSQVDIVKIQIEAAAGLPLSFAQQQIIHRGHAIECRINAEDLSELSTSFFHVPIKEHVRVDRAIETQGQIMPYYDRLIGKITVWGNDRQQAIISMRKTLAQTILVGIKSNLPLLIEVMNDDRFITGVYDTMTLSSLLMPEKTQSETTDHEHVFQCKKCMQTMPRDKFENHGYECEYCGDHPMISATQTAMLVLDQRSMIEMDSELQTYHHHGSEAYQKIIDKYQQQTHRCEAFLSAMGKISGIQVCLGVLDPTFMMGTMGSVVGEKIARLSEKASELGLPLIIVSASGGARMQEGVESLMQMAKTTMAIKRFQANRGLFISVLTDPTMGGTTASFAMQGDIVLAHPQALIGFSGKRVVTQTLHQQFDDQIQKAEVLLANGWIDKIVPRSKLKEVLAQLLVSHQSQKHSKPAEVPKFMRSDHRMSTWESVKKARDPIRIKSSILIRDCFDGFLSLHDQIITNDPALIIGIGTIAERPMTIIAHNKGSDLTSDLDHRFGMVSPIGHRKILRAIRQAEKFDRPIITIIDTPGAYPSMAAELTGQASSISNLLAEFSMLSIPIISIILSEGGSGGALALGITDVVMMMEHAYYSIISPEGYASILFRDETKAPQAASMMKITASELVEMKVIDRVINESSHHDIIHQIRSSIIHELSSLDNLSKEQLLDRRYQKFRMIASTSKQDVDEPS